MPGLRSVLAAAFLTTVACGQPLATIDVERIAITKAPPRTVLGEVLGQLGFEDFEDFDLAASQELKNQAERPPGAYMLDLPWWLPLPAQPRPSCRPPSRRS